MIGGLAKTVQVVPFADPTASKTIVVYRAAKGQGKQTITAASIASDGALSAGATNGRQFKLRKRGVDGLATAVDITATLGGTGGAYTAYVAGSPADFSVPGAASIDDVTNVLLPGEVVELVYTKAGTDTVGLSTLFLEVAAGVA
jgi:hypothetical protein